LSRVNAAGRRDERVEALAGAYGGLVKRGAQECREIPGASQSIEVLFKKFPLYVDSTTPEEPLKEILSHRRLSRYFRGVYGAPRTKSESLAEILNKESVEGRQAVFVGDSESDRDAAEKEGCRFIGIANEFNTFGSGRGFTVLSDLVRLPETIENDAATA